MVTVTLPAIRNPDAAPGVQLWQMLETHRNAAAIRTLFRYSALLCCFLSSIAVHPQIESEDTTLKQIHQRLTNREKLTYHKPVVLIAEITGLGPVFQGVCKSAVNQDVEFIVSRVLFGKFTDKVVHAGFINCTRQPLPSPPFTLHATVIMYCEHSHFLSCVNPVPYTEARQRDVQSWISSIPPELAKQQDRGDSSLWTLRVPLEDSERLVKKQGFLFEGEITRNEEIHQRRCSSGRERKTEYRVDQVLWDYPDSLLRPGYKISKGFIDCRESSMPNWPPETRVIVYCEASPGEGYSCLAPVMFTDDRLFRVKQWIAQLRIQEGNPELLKMHFLLRDSLELSPSRPLLVLGKVTWVTPKQQFGIIHSIRMVPTMRLAISRLIWGYYKELEVGADCPHRDCSNVAVGANVIAYCEPMGGVYSRPPAGCRVVSSEASEENIHRVEQWAARARERQRELIIERIRKYVAGYPPDDRSATAVYRGQAIWVGKADNGIPLVHLTDTTGRKFQQPINLLMQRHYGTDAPIAVEVGKPMIAFCVQRDDVCYNGDEVTAVIEDSDETFRAIQHLIEQAR